MFRSFTLSAISLSVASVAAFAEPPKVATDIAPIHSLVAQVMNAVGEPSLIVRQGASPHGYSMRPSEARALQNADLVVWVGPALTPWFEKPLSSLAEDAVRLELLDVPGTLQLEYRDLGDGDHGGENVHDDLDDHGADMKTDGEDGDGDERHSESGGDDDHTGRDDHRNHADVDPHAWLDPQNAQVWVLAIAERLADLDPENAEVYLLNARTTVEDLKTQERVLAAQIKGMSDQPYVAFHDAYQYFENRFGLKIAGTVALGDASDPSPARVAALQSRIRGMGVTCAFAEPQFDPRLLEAAIETGNVTIRVIDPLGSTLEAGAALYGQLISAMAGEFIACGA